MKNFENLNLQELSLESQISIDGGNGIHSGGYGLAGTKPSTQTYSELFHAAGDFLRGVWGGLG
ncbi:hypothetical protein [Empedobacter sp.]|uniref:hypothetical protein n=1 Tax=Empedobacter sp. TaxID=1927715 RepID=UPI00289892A9|nr:hypothetical protein [Empedobacter sp.]